MRRQSRELALQTLFQNEFAPKVPTADFMAVFEESFDQETRDYAEALVAGVLGNKEAIDGKIQSVSRNWKVERMASVDRNILRVAVFELAFTPEPLKANIVIDEAVEIAKKFGTTESGSFVNGLLDQIARER